jgi:hypothetical protein
VEIFSELIHDEWGPEEKKLNSQYHLLGCRLYSGIEDMKLKEHENIWQTHPYSCRGRCQVFVSLATKIYKATSKSF